MGSGKYRWGKYRGELGKSTIPLGPAAHMIKKEGNDNSLGRTHKLVEITGQRFMTHLICMHIRQIFGSPVEEPWRWLMSWLPGTKRKEKCWKGGRRSWDFNFFYGNMSKDRFLLESTFLWKEISLWMGGNFIKFPAPHIASIASPGQRSCGACPHSALVS